MITKSPWLFFGVLALFIFVIWSYYWKFQLMFNSSGVSLYTPDSFRLKNSDAYHKITESGFKYAKTQRIVIAGMVRNVELKVPAIIKRVERLGELYKDYRIIIVENDSTDTTRELLLEWVANNPKVTILGCGRNAMQCSLGLKATEGHSVDRSRIEKMVYLRNIYLKEINSKYRDFDYVAIWDMDVIGSVYLDGVANTMGYFRENSEFGGICSYGIYKWGPLSLFYDSYALKINANDDFHLETKTVDDIKKGLGMQYTRGEYPIKVVSCFSGFTIYRTDAILDIEYEMTDNIECEHSTFNKQVKGNMMLNPSMIHLVVHNP